MSVLHVTAYFFLFWSFAIPIPLYVCRPPTSVTTDNQDKEKLIFDSFEMRDSAKHLSDLPVCSALFFLLFSPINTLNTINFGILAGWALNTASLTPKERVRQMWSQAGQRNSEEEEEAEQQSDAWHNKNGQEVRPGQPVVIQCTIQYNIHCYLLLCLTF